MINKSKMLDYIESNFNIDMVAYSLISEIIDMFYNDIEKVIEILNNCRIDLTIKELKENNIIE
jgi:hypothetical protein